MSIASRPCRPTVDRAAVIRRRNDDWLSKVESGQWTTADLAAAHGLTDRAVRRALTCARELREMVRDALHAEADRIRA